MSQIPGQFINSVGGLIIVTPYGGAWGNAGNNTPEFGGWPNGTPVIPTAKVDGSTPSVGLDAQNWTLPINPIFDDVTGTQSYGGINRDKTAEDWFCTGEVVVDQRFPVDMLFKYGALFGKNSPVTAAAAGFGFNLGVRVILVQGCGTNYPSDSSQDFYWCPCAKMGRTGPVIDAGNKKDVRVPFGIMNCSRIFKMPAEINLAIDYNSHLLNRGETY